MGKYSMNTLLRDALKDGRVTEIIKTSFPTVLTHPRFLEVGDFTFRQVVDMNLAAIGGIPKSQLKKVIKVILELD